MNSKPLTDAEIAELRKLDAAATPAGRPTWRAMEIGGRLTMPALFAENAEIAGAARNALPALLDEVTRARALLRRIEWNGEFDGCPCCGGWPVNPLFAWHEGHKPDCELAALIGKAQ